MSPNKVTTSHNFEKSQKDQTICAHCGLSKHATIHPAQEMIYTPLEAEIQQGEAGLSFAQLKQSSLQTGYIGRVSTGQPLADRKQQPFEYDLEKTKFPSGAVSTKQIRLSLIPHRGLLNAAKRFELGLIRHSEGAYNNLVPNQEPLKDEAWLIERCSHAIEHLYNLLDFLTHKTTNSEAALGDAGAVAWCGLVLGEALSLQEKK